MKTCVRCSTHLTSLDLLTSLASYAVVEDLCDASDFGLISRTLSVTERAPLVSTVSQANQQFLCAVCGRLVNYELAKNKSPICSFCMLTHVTEEVFGLHKKQQVYSRITTVVDNIAETLAISADDADLKQLILLSGDRQLKIALMEQLKRRGGTL